VKPEEVPAELVKKIRLAISDPGAFLPRGREVRDGETLYESIPHWGARAVIAAVLPDHERTVRAKVSDEILAMRGTGTDQDWWDTHNEILEGAALTARAEAQPAADQATCRLYDDGQGGTVRVHGEKPLDEQGQAALRDLIRAARRRHQEEKAAERREIERQIREQVATEIDQEREAEDDGSSWGGGMAYAAEVARKGRP
jgi:hypothetical protein